jgi:hypothetical protein
MKSFALLLTFAATALACSGTENKIGGSSAPIGEGGANTGGTGTGGSGTSGSSGTGQGGGVATGGVGGTGVGGSSTTGGAAGTVGSTGGGPATGGSSGSGTGGGPAGECTQDSDCQLFAFYCTGCDCLVLAPGEAEPTCSGPGVQCFADACLNRSAVCDQGSCQVKENNCPVGQTQRNICVECGTAGGCSRMSDTCTKTCTTHADCTGFTYPGCVDGLCQMGGCI